MPSTKLTEDDLTALADGGQKNPGATIQALTAAAEGNQLEDPSDAPYALGLAADVAEAAGDTAQALVLARRAMALADEVDPGYLYPHSLLVRLLAEQGDRDEARAVLERLRAALTTYDSAPSALTEAAEPLNMQQTALDWLTEALDTLAPDRNRLPKPDQGFEIVIELLMARHDLRETLGLPHDADDELADRIDDALADALEEDDEEAPILFFPQKEFDALATLSAQALVFTGTTWDEHRSRVQSILAAFSGIGASDLAAIAATAEGYLSFVAEAKLDPGDVATAAEYADRLTDEQDAIVIPWPPGRNESCWCGSGLKYKKCCLRREKPLDIQVVDQHGKAE